MAVRSTASNVTISLGLVSFTTDLVPATKSKRIKSKATSKTKVCPTCQANDELAPLQQQFTCEHNHGPFSASDVGTALMVDGELRPLTAEDVATVSQTDGDRTGIELLVHPATDVEACTFPSGNVYRLRPRDSQAHYGLVLNLVRNRNVAFIGEWTNKGATLLYRLIEHGGVLVLTELVRPDLVHENEILPDVSFPERLLATGEMLVESLTEPFDAEQYQDRRRIRLEAMAARYRETVPTVADDTSPTEAASDLLLLLQRSVEAA